MVNLWAFLSRVSYFVIFCLLTPITFFKEVGDLVNVKSNYAGAPWTYLCRLVIFKPSFAIKLLISFSILDTTALFERASFFVVEPWNIGRPCPEKRANKANGAEKEDSHRDCNEVLKGRCKLRQVSDWQLKSDTKTNLKEEFVEESQNKILTPVRTLLRLSTENICYYDERPRD